MNRAIRKCWRDSASLIVLAKRYGEASSSVCSAGGNYDILLQTRTSRASFPNSVVFPGGVFEASDSANRWLRLFASFGYTQRDFEALHSAGSPVTPIFGENPVQRYLILKYLPLVTTTDNQIAWKAHIALRITAIRETFEELGLLLCSTEYKDKREGNWASIVKDIDFTEWQSKVSKDPEELFNLCEKYNCYPDLWSLHYWSNWLTPARAPKRFDTAFFITALKAKPNNIDNNSEVVKVEWATPYEIIVRNSKKEVELYPPQVYELNRLKSIPDIEDLIKFAKNRSCLGNELFYPVTIRARDGILHLLPGDYLYPQTVDYYNPTIRKKNNTVEELTEENKPVHRFVFQEPLGKLVTQSFTPANHINMGDISVPVNLTIH